MNFGVSQVINLDLLSCSLDWLAKNLLESNVISTIGFETKANFQKVYNIYSKMSKTRVFLIVWSFNMKIMKNFR